MKSVTTSCSAMSSTVLDFLFFNNQEAMGREHSTFEASGKIGCYTAGKEYHEATCEVISQVWMGCGNLLKEPNKRLLKSFKDFEKGVGLKKFKDIKSLLKDLNE